MASKRYTAYCEFSLSVVNLFQAEKSLAVSLYEYLKEMIITILEQFVNLNVLKENSYTF